MKIDDNLLRKLESETKKAEGPPPKGINDFVFTSTEESQITDDQLTSLVVPNENPVIEPLAIPIDTILAEIYRSDAAAREKGMNYVPKPEHKGKNIKVISPLTGVITNKVAFCTASNGPTCGNGYGNHIIIEQNLVEQGSSSWTPGTMSKVKVILSCLKQEDFTELEVGQVINERDQVGFMGNTGSSYGFNLHYELIRYLVQEDLSVKEQWVDISSPTATDE